MENKLENKRILIFLFFAFGIAWVVALIIYLTGGLANSPVLVPGIPFTLALLLAVTGYMWAPALAHIITRLISREGWGNVLLRPYFKHWPYWIAAWFVPPLVTILGTILFFTIFPNYYDPSLKRILEMLAMNWAYPIDVRKLILIQTAVGILVAPLLNGPATFGEEFGWRGYLQPKLMPLGGRKALVIIGIIWGVWHWPMIAMGHNYGLDYPGAPWLGMLMMVWFTLILGIFLGWVTIRSRCVWPAVIGHGAINGIANLGSIFVQGSPNPLLGPLPIGLIGSLPMALLALAILLIPGAHNPENIS